MRLPLLLLLACAPYAGAAWEYETKPDKMGRGTESFAYVTSSNKVNFPRPYDGGSTASIVIRKSSKHGDAVIVDISKGQLLCRVSGCTITVRFDQGKAVKWQASDNASGSSKYIFIDNHTAFVSQLRKAKTVLIELPFYQSGNEIFEFDVSGLNWK